MGNYPLRWAFGRAGRSLKWASQLIWAGWRQHQRWAFKRAWQNHKPQFPHGRILFIKIPQPLST
ncbi:hypothetical protein AXF42_Ash000866 [Apostasia shenzhenica]|uniref:Uncharacterized protein n=1 Tax=Apostasia shenzhenica TaxID=1088818 RepID=A0A2I0AT98_9ASPA|nr:hypothetical protein AXF42_Ash000866 [Apostasia shenzhenica]